MNTYIITQLITNGGKKHEQNEQRKEKDNVQHRDS